MKNKRITLTAYVITLIILMVIVVILLFALYKNNTKTPEALQENLSSTNTSIEDENLLNQTETVSKENNYFMLYKELKMD